MTLMSKTRHLTGPTIVSLALLMAATAVAADDAALKRCREVQDPSKRLACYDAITVSGTGVSAKSPAAADRFGMEQQVLRNEPEVLESMIRGRFTGWQATERIELSNGQVWQVSDGSTAALELLNPKVAVRRGSFGAFYLEVEGTNRSPRVKRVR